MPTPSAPSQLSFWRCTYEFTKSWRVPQDTLAEATGEHNSESRASLLAELEEDVCGEIEDVVRVSEALEQHLEQGIRSRGWRFYYEAISDFLAHDAEGRELAALLLPLFMGLWDLDCVRATFTLTMHRFIFGEHARAAGIQVLKPAVVIIKGANSLFWRDLNSLQARSAPLFTFLVTSVTDPHYSTPDVEASVHLSLLKLVSRFVCYYEVPGIALHGHPATVHPSHASDHDPNTPHEGKIIRTFESKSLDLSAFVAAVQQSRWMQGGISESTSSEYAPAEGRSKAAAGAEEVDLLAVEPASCVVIEIVHQLHHVSIEEALVNILHGLATLRPEVVNGLDWHTRIKLQEVLHGLSSPGGPLYPPRGIRMLARTIMDTLFPSGRHARRLVNVSFRLLNPYRWPLSLAHWVFVQTPTNLWSWTLQVVPVQLASVMAGASATVRWRLRQAEGCLRAVWVSLQGRDKSQYSS